MTRVRNLRLFLFWALFGLALDLSAQGSPGPPIIGTWEGIVTEGSKTYSLALKIERLELQSYAGTDTYTGTANCTGLLVFRRQRAGLYEFSETISSGNSCANGRVELYMANDGRLEWEWYEEGRGGDPTARATLSPRH